MALSWPSASRASSAQAPRASSVAPRGQRDLDLRGQQPRALRRLAGLADRAADRGGRGVAVALGQPQQRQAGHRLAPAAAGLAVGLLGRGELAPQAMDLPLQVDGLAAGEAVAALLAAPARALGLVAAPPATRRAGT